MLVWVRVWVYLWVVPVCVCVCAGVSVCMWVCGAAHVVWGVTWKGCCLDQLSQFDGRRETLYNTKHFVHIF